jgi:hypothetical protein
VLKCELVTASRASKRMTLETVPTRVLVEALIDATGKMDGEAATGSYSNLACHVLYNFESLLCPCRAH